MTTLKYVDTSGTLQTLVQDTDYQVDADSEPGRLLPFPGKYWPPTRRQANAVQVTFVAGYGLAAAVPDTIVCAILGASPSCITTARPARIAR